MALLLANATKSWAWAHSRFVSGIITIEAHLVRAYITKITGAITFTTGRHLAVVLDKDLKFAEAEKTRDGFIHTNTIMT